MPKVQITQPQSITWNSNSGINRSFEANNETSQSEVNVKYVYMNFLKFETEGRYQQLIIIHLNFILF